MALALKPPALPSIVQLAGVLGALLGAAFWASRLLAPAEQVLPAAPVTAQAVAAPAAAQWFANRPAQIEVSVSGVLDTGRGPVAILSVNGAPSRAVRVGETLARGVSVVAIDGQGLTLLQGGVHSQVAIARLAGTPELAPLTQP
ncbi:MULTISPECIES: general secretion pathway protein GspC [Pseudomonas]|uniref:general secretion pathway protein GspC n=1 Tax=Pseudomonas TaxID=286 RepID=UPI001E345A59|nr:MULTISPECIES: general secretion pathway protein GspC [Pseudomonas]MCE1117229.1 general secretion pathway protein GspC [Pseudomonas sp. NMI795_08]